MSGSTQSLAKFNVNQALPIDPALNFKLFVENFFFSNESDNSLTALDQYTYRVDILELPQSHTYSSKTGTYSTTILINKGRSFSAGYIHSDSYGLPVTNPRIFSNNSITVAITSDLIPAANLLRDWSCTLVMVGS